MTQTGKRVGLYPGTFDPITFGHLDIIRRSRKLVDKLVLGVAINERKGPLFSLEERIEMVRQAASEVAADLEVEVLPFNNLLMHFAEDVGAQVIIRGLRAVSDFEYEFQMTAMNEQLNREIETVFLMADVKHQAVASRLVKEIAQFDGDITPFVTPGVKKRLLEKYKK